MWVNNRNLIWKEETVVEAWYQIKRTQLHEKLISIKVTKH